MDYSGRVNAKKGGGGVAGKEETNIHTRNRIKELLATQVLDLDNDPYVFRNHLGLLECKLCLTTHVSESSYISHLGGRKHQMNLEKRRVLDEKYANSNNQPRATTVLSINNIPKRRWDKIGKPEYKLTKVRHPESLQVGILLNVKYPKIAVDEPFFRFMSYYELSTKNQTALKTDDSDPDTNQYLVVSAEPYQNICFTLPNKEIDKPQDVTQMSETYWWHWDNDTKEFFLQFMYKSGY